MNLANKIENVRVRFKFTKTEIAEKLDMDLANYTRLEKQGERLKYFQIVDIANALGVSVKELLFDEKEEKEDNNQIVSELRKEIESLRKGNELLEKIIEDKKRLLHIAEVENHELWDNIYGYISWMLEMNVLPEIYESGDLFNRVLKKFEESKTFNEIVRKPLAIPKNVLLEFCDTIDVLVYKTPLKYAYGNLMKLYNIYTKERMREMKEINEKIEIIRYHTLSLTPSHLIDSIKNATNILQMKQILEDYPEIVEKIQEIADDLYLKYPNKKYPKQRPKTE